MKNELALKVYDVDYSFIIKNYLSPDLWQKTWTLFVYKNFRITLNLYKIEVKSPVSIGFIINIQDEHYSSDIYVCHDTENSNINVLKRQINGAMRDLIRDIEKRYIETNEEYKILQNRSYEEQKKLKELANDYLDDNNVTNDDIREAYIDRYVDDNSKGWTYISNYIDGMKYKQLPDLWLVFYKATKQNNMYENVINKIEHNEYFDNMMNDIEEYINILEDDDGDEYIAYFDDMACKLESI